ncbi:hypothetical protein SAMN06297280_3441 [Arsukibacterium tuosuense]|uniref:Uncharacterized protein n=1 Tax=Arsukibacterium tuosuense TaxID=1323745 RepID=A0A285JGS6_9GAMM|nr:hypothetical protein [Arsukibacterium tuosuense]SNY58586.1 hypothetical protein SAMN06297280_3441 [Arsukibacterium tuosuense]
MRMEIKVINMAGNSSDDAIAQATASLIARGFNQSQISKNRLTEVHYDAYSAGGSEEHHNDVMLIIATK